MPFCFAMLVMIMVVGTCRDYCELEEGTQFNSPENQYFSYDFHAAFVCDDRRIIMIGEAVDFLFLRVEIVKPKTLVITRLPWKPPFSYNGSKDILYLVPSSRDCFSIDVSYGGVGEDEVIRVAVFELDFSNMSWNIVHTCPNISFFISISCHIDQLPCYYSDSTEAGNRVYMLSGESECLYTYHIQENTILKTPLASLLPTPYF